MKVPRKYRNGVIGVLMGLIMSLVMSFTMTLINIGLVPYFFSAWLKGFIIGSIVSIPTSLVVGPIIQKLIK